MEKLKFEFTVEQINLILASLGRMPYETVVQLITEVQKQAQEQINNGTRTVGPPPK